MEFDGVRFNGSIFIGGRAHLQVSAAEHLAPVMLELERLSPFKPGEYERLRLEGTNLTADMSAVDLIFGLSVVIDSWAKAKLLDVAYQAFIAPKVEAVLVDVRAKLGIKKLVAVALVLQEETSKCTVMIACIGDSESGVRASERRMMDAFEVAQVRRVLNENTVQVYHIFNGELFPEPAFFHDANAAMASLRNYVAIRNPILLNGV